jgi:hypothetical protein
LTLPRIRQELKELRTELNAFQGQEDHGVTVVRKSLCDSGIRIDFGEAVWEGPEPEWDAWVRTKPNRIFVCISSMNEGAPVNETTAAL